MKTIFSVNFMNKVDELYELVEPIVELIEENKEKIDLLISDIEDDLNTSLEDWIVIEEIESALMNLSISSGDTSIKDLKELIEGN